MNPERKNVKWFGGSGWCPRDRLVRGLDNSASPEGSVTVPSFVPTTKPYRVLLAVGVRQPTASLRYTCSIP
jgi:hypothetical protein